MIFLIPLIIVTLILILSGYNLLKQVKGLSSDEELDKLSCDLPENSEICKQMQKIVGSDCKIILDDDTKSSAYIFLNDKIILSNTEKSQSDFSRVLFIAHECIHSVQDRKMHITNFTVTNVMYLYEIFLFITIILNRANIWLIMILFLIYLLQFYNRIILETDAVYRSVWLVKEYMNGRGKDSIAKRCEEIVSQTIKSMYLMYLLPILAKLIVFMSAFLMI